MSEYSNREAIESTENLSRKEKEVDDRNQTNPENTTTLEITAPPPPAFDPIKRIKEGFNYFKINDFKVTTKALKDSTPYEMRTGRKAHVGNLRVFGCVAHMMINKDHLKKLDERSKMLVHLGVEKGSKAYRLVDPVTGKIKNQSYYRKLAEKALPKFLIFSCSDSRVCPATILNLRPGEAFMTRNIANMVPASNQNRYCEIGAIIKYAVLVCKIEAIVVIGHCRCGGIDRLVSLPAGSTPSDFVDDWVSLGKAAKAKVVAKHPKASGEELRKLVEKESVMNSLANLQSYPLVKTGVGNKKIKLIGGYYDFIGGNFEILGTRP